MASTIRDTSTTISHYKTPFTTVKVAYANAFYSFACLQLALLQAVLLQVDPSHQMTMHTNHLLDSTAPSTFFTNGRPKTAASLNFLIAFRNLTIIFFCSTLTSIEDQSFEFLNSLVRDPKQLENVILDLPILFIIVSLYENLNGVFQECIE